MNRFTRRVALSTLLVNLVWISLAEAVRSNPDVGVYTAVQGKVSVTHSNRAGPIPVKLHDTVVFRDVIETQRESQTKALLNDDSILSLGENSRIEVSEHVYDADRALRSVLVNMVRGTVRALVGKVFSGAGSRFEIHTPNAVAAARGTYFVVWTEGPLSGIANIGTHGRVDFTSAGQTVGVMPGHFSMAILGAPPAVPSALTTRPPANVRHAITATEIKDHRKRGSPHDLVGTLMAFGSSHEAKAGRESVSQQADNDQNGDTSLNEAADVYALGSATASAPLGMLAHGGADGGNGNGNGNGGNGPKSFAASIRGPGKGHGNGNGNGNDHGNGNGNDHGNGNGRNKDNRVGEGKQGKGSDRQVAKNDSSEKGRSHEKGAQGGGHSKSGQNGVAAAASGQDHGKNESKGSKWAGAGNGNQIAGDLGAGQDKGHRNGDAAKSRSGSNHEQVASASGESHADGNENQAGNGGQSNVTQSGNSGQGGSNSYAPLQTNTTIASSVAGIGPLITQSGPVTPVTPPSTISGAVGQSLGNSDHISPAADTSVPVGSLNTAPHGSGNGGGNSNTGNSDTVVQPAGQSKGNGTGNGNGSSQGNNNNAGNNHVAQTAPDQVTQIPQAPSPSETHAQQETTGTGHGNGNGNGNPSSQTSGSNGNGSNGSGKKKGNSDAARLRGRSHVTDPQIYGHPFPGGVPPGPGGGSLGMGIVGRR